MKKIVVIGDAMLDIYTFGHIHRISPEAPVPEFAKNGKEILKLGGAANTAVNIANFGADVTLVAGLGDDNAGQQFLHVLKEHTLQLKFLKIPCTTVKNRLIDEKFNQHVLRIARENTTPNIDNDAFSQILSTLVRPDVVVISDYDKGILNKYRIQTIRAAFDDVPLIVDPKNANFHHYRNASIMIPNHAEAAKGLNINEKDLLTNPTEAACSIRNNLNLEAVAITLGKMGVALATNTYAGIISTTERQVFDVTGAGDVFCAVIAYLWNDYANKAEIMQLANYVAGKSVDCLGNYIATTQDIEMAKKNLIE